MGKEKEKEKDQGGRPYKAIDWDRVDQLLEAGCDGVEIAAYFGVHSDTLYARCEKEKNSGFTAYSTEKRRCGDTILREVQFNTAREGNVTMQIWLGKNRLGQKEKQDDVLESLVDLATLKEKLLKGTLSQE